MGSKIFLIIPLLQYSMIPFFVEGRNYGTREVD
jgi:hypothetical protein